MRTQFNIGARLIGEGHPVYLIAEAGSNHNGDIGRALELIDIAAECGVDAVKFQHFKAEKLYPKSAGESAYLRSGESIFEIIAKMEMPDEWVPLLAGHCQKRNIEFLCTPFDEASADHLRSHVSAFKIASYEMTHSPLLTHVARMGKPLMISTGTATLDEVKQVVGQVSAADNDQVALLQCTAAYPAPPHSVNARAIVALRNATGCPVGLSDHSRDPIIAPVVAVALGACVIEKHFTLSNDLPGPDHRFAVEPHELRQLVSAVRTAEQMLGHGRKEVLPEELELREFARRSIFSIRAIRANEPLTANNISVLRCGTKGHGLPPDQFPLILGRVARREIPAETLISIADLS